MARFRKALVTGGRGFVGNYLIPALSDVMESDGEIYVATQQGAAATNVVPFDIQDRAAVFRVVDDIRPDLIVHLAARASVGRSLHQASETWGVNVGGTLNLADAVRALPIPPTFLFVSTAEVYGLAFNSGKPSERVIAQPQSPYARSKLAAEYLLRDVLGDAAKLLIVRPANHSGAGQSTDYVIPAFAAQIAAIERGAATNLLVGNLEAERDFLDVRDVVRAYVSLLVNSDMLSSGEIYNIGRGQAVPVQEVLHKMLSASSASPEIISDQARMRPSEIRSASVDTSKLRSVIDWSPEVELTEMLKTVLEASRVSI